MKEIHNLLRKNNIIPNKINKCNNVFIIDDKYVIKPNYNKDIYKYLDERSFDYYPKILNNDDHYLIEEYIETNDISDDLKLDEMIELVSLLHNKTTFYKKIDLMDKKEIYENISNHIMEIFKYYDEKMIEIESKEIYSPSEYSLSKNISLVFLSLNKSKEKLDIWFNNAKDIDKFRYTINHNNLDLAHFIKNDKNYLISWNKAKVDLPIYDLYNLFINNDLDYDMVLERYMENSPFNNYEKDLLYIYLLIPPKLCNKESEYDKTVEVVRMLDKLNKFNNLK